jgi:Surface lipoprotein
MKKILLTSLITLIFTFNASAGTDGEINLSKNNPQQIKDCFEGLNRATFALNQGLDKVIFKPVAKAYRTLPSPVRTGTNNVLINLSSLVTIPNNVLKGEIKTAGVNTGRFIINTNM